MLDGEQIAGLVGYELIKVNQAVEKDTDLRHIVLQQIWREVALRDRRFEHIIHLAQ